MEGRLEGIERNLRKLKEGSGLKIWKIKELRERERILMKMEKVGGKVRGGGGWYDWGKPWRGLDD